MSNESNLYSSLSVLAAARATSAAPTYFKSINLTLHNGDTRTYVDGGVNTNSATLEAYRFIKQLDPHDEYRWEMLSIGTASAKLPEISDGGLATGLINGLVDNLYNNSEKDTVNFAGYLMQHDYKDRHSFMRIDMTPDKKIPMDSVDDKTMNQLLDLAQTQYEQKNSRFNAVVKHLIFSNKN